MRRHTVSLNWAEMHTLYRGLESYVPSVIVSNSVPDETTSGTFLRHVLATFQAI